MDQSFDQSFDQFFDQFFDQYFDLYLTSLLTSPRHPTPPLIRTRTQREGERKQWWGRERVKEEMEGGTELERVPERDVSWVTCL